MSRRFVDDEWFRGCTLWKKSRRSEPLTQKQQRELQLWEREQRQEYTKFQRGDPSARLDKDGFEFLTMLGFDLNIEDGEHGDNEEQEAQKEEEETTENLALSDSNSHPRLNARTLGFSREAPRTRRPWDEMYESLETFHQTNGHVNVPYSSSDKQVKKLYKWLVDQRKRYRAMMHPRSSVGGHGSKVRPMTSDECVKLTALGVELAVAPARTMMPWKETYESLEGFHQKNGHIKVPPNSSDVQVKKLHSWIGNQKTRYRAMVDKEYAKKVALRPMTPDEHGKLVALGVNFGPSSSGTKTPRTTSGQTCRKRNWEENYAALKQFQEEHGHVRVSADNKKLYNFVQTQKDRYKLTTDKNYRNPSRRKPLGSLEHEKLVALGVNFGPSTSDRSARPKRTRPIVATPAPSAKRMRQDDHCNDVSSVSEEVSNANPHDAKEETLTNLKNDASDLSSNIAPGAGSGEEEEQGGEAEAAPEQETLNRASDGTQNGPDAEAYANYWSSRNFMQRGYLYI